MSLVVKSLAVGKLGTALTTLYEVQSPNIAARVTQMILANTDTANNYSGLLYVQPASLSVTTSHLLVGAGTLVLAGGSVETPTNGLALMLSQGDKIQGICDTADVVDYFICGAEE